MPIEITEPVQCFNPRPREGGDANVVAMEQLVAFQSTPPRRGRRTGA